MLRVWLACTRLLLLYVAAWILVVQFGLQVRSAGESGGGLDGPVATLDLPFAGINVALEQYSPPEQATALARLAGLGFGWVRQHVDWGIVEPRPGAYDWTATDSILASILRAGLEPVFVLDGSPAWARDPRDRGAHDNPRAPPADLSAFTEFATAFAQRYAGQVRYYQIWDEPNVAPNWGERRIDPVAYAQMLKPASAAIRDADPDAVILLAALAPTVDRGHTAIDEVYFLQRLYASGAAPFFDAVAVQPFGFGNAPDEPAQRLDVLDFRRATIVRRAMVNAGDTTTPILGVRYGWNTYLNSPWATVRSDLQAEFAARSVAIARAEWPWMAGLAWVIDQPATPATDPMWGFALTEPLATALSGTLAGGASQAGAPPARPGLGAWVLLLAGASLVVWRAWAAARVLPKSAWAERYRRWPLAVHVAVWGGLIVVYFFASVPPIIVLCWLAAAVLVWLQPQAGLWLAAALLPFYFWHKELHLVNVTLAIAPAYVLIACLTPVMAVRLTRRRFRLDAPDWLALAWIGITLATGVNVWHWPAYTRGLLELAVAPVLLYLAARMLITDESSRRRVATAMVGGATVATVLGLLDWLAGGGTVADNVRRLVGPYFSANHMALYLERSLLLATGLALGGRGRERMALAAMSALIAVALLLTGSRGALLLGLPAGLIYLVWAAMRTGHRISPRLATPVIVVAAVAGGLLVWLYWPRISNSATILDRLAVWQASLHLWVDFPWLGVGPDGFFWRFPAYIPQDSLLDPNLRHAHNVWLEYATGWGAAGLVWLLAAGIAVVRASGQPPATPAARWLQWGIQAALLAGLVHGQVDAFAALPDLAAWNWLAVALLLAPINEAAPCGEASHN